MFLFRPASQPAEKLGWIRRSGSAALQRRVQVLYSCHHEPASAGEGPAVLYFSANFSADDTAHRAHYYGNLLQLLHRNRRALSAPPGHAAAHVPTRLGADGDMERRRHLAGSRIARHRCHLREVGAASAQDSQSERACLLRPGSTGRSGGVEGGSGRRGTHAAGGYGPRTILGGGLPQAQRGTTRSGSVAGYGANSSAGDTPEPAKPGGIAVSSDAPCTWKIWSGG